MLNFPALAALIIPIVNIDFMCPVNITSQAFADADSIFGPMVINDVNRFKCSGGVDGFQRANGIDTPRIQSNESIASLKHRFERRQGLTVETWITPKDIGSSDYLPIVTIGSLKDLPHSMRPRDRCHDHDFRLSQYGSYLQLSYTSMGKCQTAIITSIPLVSALTHIVVALTNTTTRVHINGIAARTGTITTFMDQHLDNWNSTYGLQLFSDFVSPIIEVPNAPDQVFAGAIHSVKLYDFAIKDDDVTILFRAGLRSGVPTDSSTDDASNGDALRQNSTIVTSRLTPSFSEIVLKEGKTENSPFTIGGDVYGLNVSTVLVEIVSVPVYGRLFFNGIHITAGDRLPTKNYLASVTFGGLDEDFFNVANTTSDRVDLGLELASFEFRLIEVDGSVVLAASDTARPLIRVVNVNDVPTLVVPDEIYLTGEKSSQGRDIYIVNGIHLDDSKDRNVDKVRVEIEVKGKSGDVQLNQEYLHLAEFSLCSLRSYSDWKCRGDGNGRSMTFIAEPGNVDLILSDMTYTPYFLKTDDQIVVRVYDGEGGDCLDAAEHVLYGNAQMSMHPRCTLIMGSIYIPKPSDTKRFPGEEEEVVERNFFQKAWDAVFAVFNKNWFLVGILGFSILVMTVLVVCCYMRCRTKKSQQGKEQRGKDDPKTVSGGQVDASNLA